ncbi:DUF4062 domain-containing protein [Dactylosporangium sp. CS-033363]|uniref:DUF4062 domain-containing protein n=1 Tax=Dactylosporangium sp. CS-033363 TaxID=3239935 RepID=UPI003D908BCD
MATEVKYQVFVSSTSRDLEVERRRVIEALLESSFIPVGMELFNAFAEQAWPTIERIIEPCDYYVVIVAGRYGSVRPNGLSFTESEYEFARHLGKPVLAFLRRDPGPSSDEDVEHQRKVRAFRDRLEGELTCKYWDSADDLALHVVTALNRAVHDRPQIGWVRANTIGAPLERVFADVVEPAQTLGISRISANGQAGAAMSATIEAARTVRIMSTSATRLLDIQKPYLARALLHGADVRVLVPAAESMFLLDVDEMEDRDPADPIATEVAQASRRLREVLADARRLNRGRDAPLGRVRLGFFSTHLRSTLVLCDESWGWLTVTLPPLRAAETASFELVDGSSKALLDDCVHHFDRVWEVVEARGDATTIE